MKKFLMGVLILSLPALAFAQTGFGTGTIGGILTTIFNIISFLIPMAIVVGVLYFIWGVVQYVISSSEDKKAEGRAHMIYAVIGLFVITAVFGLVSVLKNTFGIGSAPFPIPCPFGNTSAPGDC